MELGWRPMMRSFEQLLFSKEEFHYLNVTRVGIFTLHDLLDCTFRCLKNVLCLSINMAAFKGADGKLWCELLSSDKYRDSTNYQENTSSLHLFIQVGTYLSNTKTACSFIQLFFRNSLVSQIIFFLFKSPCSSSPCQNCLCEQSFAGEYCEKGN